MLGRGVRAAVVEGRGGRRVDDREIGEQADVHAGGGIDERLVRRDAGLDVLVHADHEHAIARRAAPRAPTRGRGSRRRPRRRPAAAERERRRARTASAARRRARAARDHAADLAAGARDDDPRHRRHASGWAIVSDPRRASASSVAPPTQGAASARAPGQAEVLDGDAAQRRPERRGPRRWRCRAGRTPRSSFRARPARRRARRTRRSRARWACRRSA